MADHPAPSQFCFAIFFFLKFIYLSIYFWLHWVFVRAFFSSCGAWGLLFVAVLGLLIVVDSFVGSTGSRRVGFSSCGTRAQ